MNIPSSKEAEASLIGACLCDAEQDNIFSFCCELGVKDEHFHYPENKIIWQSMIDLRCNTKIIDIVTVEDKLKNTHNLERVGGAKYLTVCADSVPTVSHIEYYAEILFKKEKLRRGLHISKDIERQINSEDCDPDDLLAGIVEMAMNKMARERKSPADFHLEHIERRDRAKADGMVGFPVRNKAIGRLIASWIPPECVIIAAKSSYGKTDFLLNEFVPAAISGIPVAISQTDMTEFDMRERMAGFIAGVNIFTFRWQNWKEDDAHKIDEAWRILNDLPIYIDDNSNANINDVCFFGMLCAMKHGVKLFGVDFLQQIEDTAMEGRRDHRINIGKRSGKIKSLGKRYDMCTFILSQIARYGKKDEDITPQVPNKEALKESGDVENNADIVILIAAEPNRPIAQYTFENPMWDMVANVDKQRCGPTGRVPISFYPSRHKFMARQEGDLIREGIEERLDNE